MAVDLEVITIYKVRDLNNLEFRIIIRPENHFHDNLASW